MKKEDTNFKFQAKWITAPGTERIKNCFFRAWRVFNLSEVPASLPLRIAAESYYRLFLNGRFVAWGPVRGTHRLNYFDTHELAGFLQAGRNTVSVIVQSPGVENFVAAPVVPAFIAECDLFRTDRSWQAEVAPDWLPDETYFSMQSGFMEHRDLRKEPLLWHQNGLKDVAVEVDNPKLTEKQLRARNIGSLCEKIWHPCSVTAMEVEVQQLSDGEKIGELLNREKWHTPAAGRLVGLDSLCQEDGNGMAVIVPGTEGVALIFDFGEELIGQMRILIDAPEGVIADMTYGEMLWHDRVRASFDVGIYYFTDRYHLRSGNNEIGSQLGERGFRRLQLVLRNLSDSVTIRCVEMTDRRYDYRHHGVFDSSDPLLNRLYLVCQNTLSACTSDIFIDCPWRERAFWVNDLLLENKGSLIAFGASAIHQRAFELLFSEQRSDGYVPGVCPAPEREGFESNVLPATNLFLFLIMEDYLLHSGDGATVERYWPNLLKIIDAVELEMDGDGLVGAPERFWNFYDWSFENNGFNFTLCRESMFNSLYLGALQAFQRMAKFLNKSLDERYNRIQTRIKSAFIERFYCPEAGKIVDTARKKQPDGEWKTCSLSSQLAHALALEFDALPPALQVRAQASVNDPDLLVPDYYLHAFVLRQLWRQNQAEAALERIRLHWGRCLATGSTTLYESGIHQFGLAGALGDSGSCCHGFGCAPLELMMTIILGVRPLSPGFGEFSFMPQSLDLEYASGTIPTPHGDIEVGWRKSGATLAVCLRVPACCCAITASGRRLGPGLHEFELKEVKG